MKFTTEIKNYYIVRLNYTFQNKEYTSTVDFGLSQTHHVVEKLKRIEFNIVRSEEGYWGIEDIMGTKLIILHSGFRELDPRFNSISEAKAFGIRVKRAAKAEAKRLSEREDS